MKKQLKKKSDGKEKVIIFMDGSNFYHRLRDKELDYKNLSKFKYKALAQWLGQDRKIIECIYYIGLVRKEIGNKKSEELVQNQQRLFSHLKQEGWVIQTGYMMKHGRDYKEKGVDVRLALDILDKAYQGEYDTAIIVSSDTDLIPAIEKAKKLGKKIEYIGFSHRPSYGILNNATTSRLLTDYELKQFLTDK